MAETKKENTEKAPEITDEAPKNEDKSVKTADVTPTEDDGDFSGQILHGKHYAVETKEVFGRQIVEIKPIGWIGTGLEVSATRSKEIATLLNKVKALPKQD